MDLDKSIDEVAANYANRGYTVVGRPKPEDLPDFAKDFNVQVVARMRDIGVLVAIKLNRDEFASDPEMDRYAEITSTQKGWRFDFVLLEGSGRNREVQGAQELTDEQFEARLQTVERLLHEGELSLAYIAAWASFEGAMRRVLKSAGMLAGWGTPPRQMINELVSNGFISIEDHLRLYDASRLRNEIVHGFAVRNIENTDINFLLDLTNRLLVASKDTRPQLD